VVVQRVPERSCDRRPNCLRAADPGAPSWSTTEQWLWLKWWKTLATRLCRSELAPRDSTGSTLRRTLREKMTMPERALPRGYGSHGHDSVWGLEKVLAAVDSWV